MSDPLAKQKQQMLLKYILQALEKSTLAFQQFLKTGTQASFATNTFYPSAHWQLFNRTSLQEISSYFNSTQEKPELHDTQDIATLESLLLERITFLEKRLLPEELRIRAEQFSLFKRAMLILKCLQTIYEQGEQALSQHPQNASDSHATRWLQNALPGGDHTSLHLSQARQNAVSLPPPHPVSREQPLPLSFAQQRLWFLHQLEPDSNAYAIAGAVHLQGLLHIAALERSLNEIIRRHEILRTLFREYDKQITQNIIPAVLITLPCIDLQRCSASEQTIEVQRLFSAEAEYPFDLQHVPLIRGRLLHLGKQEYTLLLTVHHIAFDGWSLGIFLRELASLYEAFSQDKPSPLPELPIQYADYAQWQHRWLRGERLEQLIDYWRTFLAGTPTSLTLPTDRPHSPGDNSAGATYTFSLLDLPAEGLHRLAQQEGVTLFMLLLAAFQVMLYRWSGQEDFVVGTDIANRTQANTEGLIGFFVNLLALRARVSGNLSFQSYLQQVREHVLAAYVHQALPFEKLIETLHIPRTENQVPLVQVLFVLQNTPETRLELPDLTLEVNAVPIAQAKFDLAVFLEEQTQGLTGTITYRTALFEEKTIQRLVGWFATLLAGIIEHPQTSIDALPIYTQQEQEKFRRKEREFHDKKSAKVKIARRRTIQIAQ
jgi:NRPS condensation-like uncharacterized protein